MSQQAIEQFKRECNILGVQEPKRIFIAWLVKDKFKQSQCITLCEDGKMTVPAKALGGVEGIAKISAGRWVWDCDRESAVEEIKRRATWKFRG